MPSAGQVGFQTAVQMYVIKFKSEQLLSCIYFTLLNNGCEERSLVKDHGHSDEGTWTF
jgi:hypothetical protein